MRVFLVEPPGPVVTWEDASDHLKLDGDTTQKALVEGMIAAATDNIDGPDGWLGRALGVQTLEARLDHFDCGSIRLPYQPVIEIVSVGYADTTGDILTIDPANYELLGPSLVSAFGFTWPSPRWQREAVRIRYRAGYPDGIPPAARAAILLMVGDLYRFRETASLGNNVAAAVPMSTTVENLLSPLRVLG